MTDASRPIRWGILGTAKIATKVGRAIDRAQGAQLVAVASRDLERARTWAAQHRVESATGGTTSNESVCDLPPIRALGSYDALIDDGEIDAVYIPLPPSMHCEWTLRAARRGKHVLCEKPVALDAAQAREMAAACREAGVQFMDGTMWTHHDRTPAMEKILRDGSLGKLRRVTAAFSFNTSDLGPDNIRFDRALGGGALGDVGWYCARAILWAFGDFPERIFATARYERDVEMNLSALLWFRDQRMASFECAFDTVWRKWFEVAGTEGSLVCDDFVQPWDVTKGRFWVHGKAGQATEHRYPDCHHEVRMVERMCAIAQSGRLEDRWPLEAIATQRLLDAVGRAARTGQIVELGSE